jgi:hypothetical protein
VTTTGCFIWSTLWTKLGPVQSLSNPQSRWTGYPEQTNAYLSSPEQCHVALPRSAGGRVSAKRYKMGPSAPRMIRASARRAR